MAAYNELRKHAELITNLFTLMADSGVKDIPSANEVIPKVFHFILFYFYFYFYFHFYSNFLFHFLIFFLQLQKKFRMDLEDEEAATFLQTIINESVSAVLPQMVESIHRWAQQRRN